MRCAYKREYNGSAVKVSKFTVVYLVNPQHRIILLQVVGFSPIGHSVSLRFGARVATLQC